MSDEQEIQSSWSPGGWCEHCGQYSHATALYVAPDGWGTWRCSAHVPGGYVPAPGRVDPVQADRT